MFRICKMKKFWLPGKQEICYTYDKRNLVIFEQIRRIRRAWRGLGGKLYDENACAVCLCGRK